jgi:hypothetical protein
VIQQRPGQEIDLGASSAASPNQPTPRLVASVATSDDMLVSLTADIATAIFHCIIAVQRDVKQATTTLAAEG